jgi:ACR3 family arsenite efflux pump ArsB
MALEYNLRETINSLRSTRLVILTLVWGWVVNPSLVVLLTNVMPLA